MTDVYLNPPAAPVTPFPGALPPMPAVARILARYDRPRLAAFIAIAIDLMDLLGPDTEENPDFRPCSDGLPGNPDDGEAYPDNEQDDEPEEDDPAGQCDEDGINTGSRVPYLYGGVDHSGPGCPISDEGEPDWRQLRKVKSGEDHGFDDII